MPLLWFILSLLIFHIRILYQIILISIHMDVYYQESYLQLFYWTHWIRRSVLWIDLCLYFRQYVCPLFVGHSLRRYGVCLFFKTTLSISKDLSICMIIDDNVAHHVSQMAFQKSLLIWDYRGLCIHKSCFVAFLAFSSQLFPILNLGLKGIK